MRRPKNPTPFYVINYDFNSKEFVKYNVMPYLMRSYDEVKRRKDKPTTFDEFKEFVRDKSLYMYWSRCQYEIILSDWPPSGKEKKIDVHWQLMNNWDLVTEVLMRNVGVEIKKS